ncbi:MAG: MFS transporter [Dehalococcoidia bacterium]
MSALASARLGRVHRLLYASGSISGNAISRSLDLWLLFFYAPPADADISRRAGTLAVGLVLSAVRLIEALDDPLIGYLSDRTRSRLGRRVPYVLAATPLLAATFVLLWMPPELGESATNVVYLFVVLWAFHLCSTLSGGPFESLLPEIAPRAEDRIDIVTWQVGLGVIGALIGLVGAAALKDAIGFQGMAITVATIALASRYIALAGAWRPAMAAARVQRAEEERVGRVPGPSLVASLRICLRNDQFVAFLPSFILYNMGVLMITGVLPFLAAAVLERGVEGSADFHVPGLGFGLDPVTGMLAVAIAVVVLLLPVMLRWSLRRGKRIVYARGMLAGVVAFPLVALVGLLPGIPLMWQAIMVAALVGVPLAPVQTFPNALIADITDYDHLTTGARREALYYATQATFEKVAAALAPALLATLLVLGSTTDNALGIRLVGPVAGLATLGGYLVFRRYWLPDEVTAESVAAARGRRVARER